jgi:AraC-like DNA-binding protein
MNLSSSPPGPSERLFPLPWLEFSGRFASSRNIETHTHPFLELVFVTQGRCRILAGNTWLAGKPGTLFVLPARVPQFQQTLEYTCTTYIGFQLAASAFNQSPRTIQLSLDGFGSQWIENLCDLNQSGGQAAGRVVSHLLMALVEHLNALETNEQAATALHPCLAKALRFIQEHQQESFRLSELADRVHLSPGHLSALFRKQFGYGPVRYLQYLRIRRAEQLLHNPHLTVQEVAYVCGFADVNYFGRVFRKAHGVSPGRWRKAAVKRDA